MLAITNHTVKRRIFTQFLRQVAGDKKYTSSHERVCAQSEIKRYESKQIAKSRVKHSGRARQFDNDANFRD